jgi:multiple sugar transport system substrate-binding protein
MAPTPEKNEVQATGVSRRRFLQFLVGGSGAAVLAACGAPNPAADSGSAPAATTSSAPAPTSAPAVGSGTSNLVVMSGPNDMPDETIAKFQAAFPNIKIERIDRDLTRLNAMVAAGTPPDLINLSAPQMPLLVIQNQLLDLTSYFAGSQKLKADDLGPSISYWKFNGKKLGDGSIYGMHKDWSPDLSLFINMAAFEEAGIPIPAADKVYTYAELAELAPQLTKRAGERIERVGGHIEHGWIEGYVQRRLLEEGESPFAPDYTRANIKDNPKISEFLRYIYDLSKANLIWHPLNPSPTGWSGDDFLKGQMGLLQMGYWYSGSVRGAQDSPIKDQIMMLPGATWSGNRANPSLGGSGFSIAKSTKNPDAAWSFFEYYMGDEPAQDRARSGWGVPALKSLYSLLPQETAFDKQTYAVLQDEMKYADKPMDINPYSQGWGVWIDYLELALREEINFEQLIEQFDEKVNQNIADGRAAAGA